MSEDRQSHQAEALIASLLFFILALPLTDALSAAPETTAEPGHGKHDNHANHDHSHHLALLNQDSGYKKSKSFYSLPDLYLIDDNSTSISIKNILDAPEPILLNFIFTSCTTICPAMSATFSSTHQRIVEEGESARFISISIDPEYDTPKRLKEYAKQHSAGPNWTFLTGKLEDIERVQKAFKAYRGDKMNHTPITFLRSNPDAPWVRIEGFTSTEELLKEYRSLSMP